jgi:hypothetical protein
MARRLLRIASIGVAGGAGFGVLFGAFYLFQAIKSWNSPGLSGLVAGWAVVVWTISAVVAGFAKWSWRAPFKQALIGLTIAGAISGYWAILYLGHDLTPWPSIGFGLVTVIVLSSAAVACAAFLRQRRIGDGSGRNSN